MEATTDRLVEAGQSAVQAAGALAAQYAFSVLGAIILLVVGYIVAGLAERWLFAGLKRVRGFDETLRVNGVAKLRDEAHYTALFASEGFRPKIVLEIQVHEAYLHCAKALMRARLWKPESQVSRNVMPSVNQMI
ncbi:MAG: hypothetical protein J0H60_11070, partial [Rhizobiales bacterium]|nr:hypothetical protein [Hyphomicrobiales bacterium]